MGLRIGDLKDCVDHIFEIDSFKSKMGDDKDIVTLSFSVAEKHAADDLMNFIEKGYEFVLDADATAGEQSDGTYKVFVELERNRHISDNILEIADGVGKLSGLDGFKFRYYKNFRSKPLEKTILDSIIPQDAKAYEQKVNESNLDNYKNFFNNSYLEELDMRNDQIRLKKAYAEPIVFEFKDFGSKEEVLERLDEKINVNDFAEIIFLCKYVGDYNITKYGDKLMFENADSALVLKRL
jgi:hypothetical protein|tara:strand:+ start:1028 stop:1741 length:714 start_codon:yes stop_codon:yes gene_type:complete